MENAPPTCAITGFPHGRLQSRDGTTHLHCIECLPVNERNLLSLIRYAFPTGTSNPVKADFAIRATQRLRQIAHSGTT